METNGLAAYLNRYPDVFDHADAATASSCNARRAGHEHQRRCCGRGGNRRPHSSQQRLARFERGS